MSGKSTTQSHTSLEETLITRFFRAVIRDMTAEEREGIHVTDLVYPCLRHAYYAKMHPQYSLDREGLLVVWIGRQIHASPVCEEHEVEVSAEIDGVKVTGRIDELCQIDGEWVIVDKKTTRNTPSSPHEHYVKQLTFYAWLLKQTRGIEVRKVALLYINVASNEVKVFVIPLTPMAIEEAGRELTEKAKALHEALARKVAPPRRFSWLCNYCTFFTQCVSEV